MQRVLKPVVAADDVHIFRGILRCAGAKAVEAEGILVARALAVVVFAAGVKLAVDEIPVVALFDGVPVDRTAAAAVLDLDGMVGEARDGDDAAKALPRLVNGVGEDLKKGVLAPLDPVRPKDDGGALAHPVGSLQLFDAFVAVACGGFDRHLLVHPSKIKSRAAENGILSGAVLPPRLSGRTALNRRKRRPPKRRKRRRNSEKNRYSKI